jgi:hypothetical protein
MPSANPDRPDQSRGDSKVATDGYLLIQRKTLTNKYDCETVRHGKKIFQHIIKAGTNWPVKPTKAAQPKTKCAL